RECFPPRVRGCPAHGMLPIAPRPLAIHILAAVPLLPPSGIEVPRVARLPCQIFVSTNAACERRSSLRFLIDWIQNQCHGAREGLPLRSFGRELTTPERRQAIEPGRLAFVRYFPRRCDPALCLQTMECRIQ